MQHCPEISSRPKRRQCIGVCTITINTLKNFSMKRGLGGSQQAQNNWAENYWECQGQDSKREEEKTYPRGHWECQRWDEGELSRPLGILQCDWGDLRHGGAWARDYGKARKGQGPTCWVHKAHLTGLLDAEVSSGKGMESSVCWACADDCDKDHRGWRERKWYLEYHVCQCN